MEIAASRRKVPATRSDWRLYHLTDLHIEERTHAAPELAAFLKRIEDDDHALVVCGGDYGGLVLPGDPRGGDGWAEGVPGDRIPDFVLETVVDKLRPIRDKIIGFGAGNHEWTLMQKWHRGIAAEMAAELGVQHLYLGQRGWMPVTFHKDSKSMTLKVYWHHGWSAGRGKSRKVLQEERDLGARDAHVHCLGHDHQPFISTWYREELYYTSRSTRWKLRHVPVCFMNGGSWTYGQGHPDPKKAAKKASEMRNELWVEKKNYRPEPPRSPVLHITVDMGNGRRKPTDDKAAWSGRPQGFDFTTELAAPRFYPGD